MSEQIMYRGEARRKTEQIGEHETKFVLSNRRTASMNGWLSKRCEVDPAFPRGIVSSIYFDTADWKFLGEKLNSDHLKTKVRLRWYGNPETADIYPDSFLECKYKIGSARKKFRVKTGVDAGVLQKMRLENLELMKIPAMTHNFGVLLPLPLFPVFQINYIRHRYVDPFTGARLAMDSDIHVSRVNHRMVQGGNRTCLPDAVFEVKMASPSLPDWLHQMTAFGCRKNSFSKYLNCYCHVTRRFF